MERADVIKALEICGSEKGCCEECPAWDDVTTSRCREVYSTAAELLKQKTAPGVGE